MNKFVVLAALATLLVGSVFAGYVYISGRLYSSTVTFPQQSTLRVVYQETKTRDGKPTQVDIVCDMHWDLINNRFRFECNDDTEEMEVVLISDLGAPGGVRTTHTFYTASTTTDWLNTTGTRPAEAVYNAGTQRVLNQAFECQANPSSEDDTGSLSINFYRDCSSTSKSFRVLQNGQVSYLQASVKGGHATITKLDQPSACSAGGTLVTSHKATTFASDEGMFQSPPGCDPTKVSEADLMDSLDNMYAYSVEVDPREAPTVVQPDHLWTPPPLDSPVDPWAGYSEQAHNRNADARRMLLEKNLEGGAPKNFAEQIIIPKTNWCGQGTNCNCHGQPSNNVNHNGCPANDDASDTCCVSHLKGIDKYCRQHDKCPIAWESHSPCSCDRAIFVGTFAISTSSAPAILFHPNSGYHCKNWDDVCTSRNWIGICQTRGRAWKKRRFTKYSGGDPLDVPAGYPLAAPFSNDGTCGGFNGFQSNYNGGLGKLQRNTAVTRTASSDEWQVYPNNGQCANGIGNAQCTVDHGTFTAMGLTEFHETGVYKDFELQAQTTYCIEFSGRTTQPAGIFVNHCNDGFTSDLHQDCHDNGYWDNTPKLSATTSALLQEVSGADFELGGEWWSQQEFETGWFSHSAKGPHNMYRVGVHFKWHAALNSAVTRKMHVGPMTIYEGACGPLPPPVNPRPAPAPTPIAQSGGLDLTNGWQNYGSSYVPASWVTKGGVCQLAGLIRYGQATQTMFNLPAGVCRPARNLIFEVIANGAGVRLNVNADGTVRFDTQAVTPSNTWVSLQGVRFFVADEYAPMIPLSTYTNYGNDYEDARYHLSINVCTLAGLVKHTSASLPGVVGTLPAECRPKHRLIFNVNRHLYNSRVDIDTDGVIRFLGGGSTYSWISLSGIQFVRQQQPQPSLALAAPVVPYGGLYGNPTVVRIHCRCYLHGLVKGMDYDGSSNNRPLLATLPETCRPSKRLIFEVFVGPNTGLNQMARIDIDNQGKVYFWGGVMASWLPLAGISFDVSEGTSCYTNPIGQQTATIDGGIAGLDPVPVSTDFLAQG